MSPSTRQSYSTYNSNYSVGAVPIMFLVVHWCKLFQPSLKSMTNHAINQLGQLRNRAGKVKFKNIIFHQFFASVRYKIPTKSVSKERIIHKRTRETTEATTTKKKGGFATRWLTTDACRDWAIPLPTKSVKNARNELTQTTHTNDWKVWLH